MQLDHRLLPAAHARTLAQQTTIARIEVNRLLRGEEHERIYLVAWQSQSLHTRIGMCCLQSCQRLRDRCSLSLGSAV